MPSDGHRSLALALLSLALYWFPLLDAWTKLVAWVGAFLATGGVHWCYLVYHTAKRDGR